MTHSSEQALLRAYARIARPIEMQWLAVRNSCIASTWVAVEALGKLGVQAKPFPVQPIVRNAIRARRFQAWHDVNPDPPPIADQLRWQQEGAHEIAIGFGGDPEGYNGHLVVVTSGGLLLDPSIDQVERPAKGIGPFPESLVSTVSGAFLRAEHPLHLSDDGGSHFYYYARPADTVWQSSLDWADGGIRYSPAVDAIVAALKPTLAGAV